MSPKGVDLFAIGAGVVELANKIASKIPDADPERQRRREERRRLHRLAYLHGRSAEIREDLEHRGPIGQRIGRRVLARLEAELATMEAAP